MSSPRVSIVTPVYNGGPYLRECLESVLRQTYDNWDYTLVNNCSTDDTQLIAEEYARRDGRIRIHNNTCHVRVVANHNIAIRAISPDSKYCKVLFADDWLFENCLSAMVQLAEAHPTVGIVGAYGLCGTRVAWHGLPFPTPIVPGHSIARAHLLGELSVFGSPTSTMLRSDLVRARDPFYNESNLHADREACFETLRHWDFGFVHEVLTFTRMDNESLRRMAGRLNMHLVGFIDDVLKFGKIYLSDTEYEKRLEDLWDEYYTFLARSLFEKRVTGFWSFHRRKLCDMGHPLHRLRLLKAVVARVFNAVLNPKRTLEIIWKRLHSATAR